MPSTRKPEEITTPMLPWATALFSIAGPLWAAAIILAVWDFTHHDQLPDTTDTTAAVLALTATTVGVQCYIAHLQRRAVLPAIAEMRADTGNLPRITDSLEDMPTISQAFHAVAVLSGEVHEMGVAVEAMRSVHERGRWPSMDRDELLARLSEPVEAEEAMVPTATVHEMTKEAYRLARRTRRNAEGE